MKQTLFAAVSGLVLGACEEREFDVSHIPGAI
jgi:hypothetical protein